MKAVSMPRHQVTRIRRDIRRRVVEVISAERLTPRMQRVRFASADLHDFESASPDDHIKLFLPIAGQPDTYCMRDYTPRAFDPKDGTLTIDFALHDAGPATAWALAARVGERLAIGGPRGSTIVMDDFDWYLLIGDETALPAIGRRIEALRPGVAVTSIIVIESPAEQQEFTTRAAWTPIWVSRHNVAGEDTELLVRALAEHINPPGDGYIWIAAEANVARALKTYAADSLLHPKAWLKASGYWMRGAANTHETIGD